MLIPKNAKPADSPAATSTVEPWKSRAWTGEKGLVAGKKAESELTIVAGTAAALIWATASNLLPPIALVASLPGAATATPHRRVPTAADPVTDARPFRMRADQS